jgi:long-chain acyl-CoA synthetase
MGLFEDHAHDNADGVAIVDGDLRRTWSAWNERATRLANALADNGVDPGGRILLHARNGAEWLDTNFALSKIGASVVSINPRLVESEIRYIADNSGATGLISDQARLCAGATTWKTPAGTPLLVVGIREAASIPGVTAFETLVATGDSTAREAIGGPLGASLLYTSGTTGAPKGAIRTPPSDPTVMAAAMRTIIDRFGMRPGERHLVVCPLCHAAPPVYAQMAHLLGGTAVVAARFDAEEALSIIAAEGITSTFMVPTMLNRLVSLPEDVRARYDHSTLRTIITGGSMCSPTLKERIVEMFGEVLFDLYGSTESGLNTMLEPRDQLKHGDSVGLLLPGNEISFRDESGAEVMPGQPGQIWLRGPLQIDGYHDDPTATAAAIKDGWITPGDIGYADADGYIHILDRAKDMVISGGVNIYPAEIEAALAKHPAVFDSAVICVPHHDWGEALLAIVERHPESTVTEAELEEFCRGHLAAYKCPRQWRFIDEFPRNHVGKILKRDLRAPYWANRRTKV